MLWPEHSCLRRLCVCMHLFKPGCSRQRVAAGMTRISLHKQSLLKVASDGSPETQKAYAGKYQTHIVTQLWVAVRCQRNQGSRSGVPISLHVECPDSSGVWHCVASSCTNEDGRIGDLLPPSDTVVPGTYM